jgi:hypothetical protein
MKLRREVDAKTFREVTTEVDAAPDQPAREHKWLTTEAVMQELTDPSLAWEDLSAEDRHVLTEMLVDKIIIERHPSETRMVGVTTPSAPSHAKIPSKGCAAKAVHEARVKIIPRV